jgi:uncharacterized membrane protein
MTQTLLAGVGRHVSASLPWMSWNLVLAVTPWAFAVCAGRTSRSMRRASLVAAALSVAFLPNAPYVLTDVVHLPRHIRAEPSDAIVLAGVLPLFAGFMAVGFVAYVDTVRRIAAWVQDRGWSPRPSVIELSLHAASTIGIYLGRVHRFNSWDLALRPEEIVATVLRSFARPLPIAGMVVTFLVLVIGQATLYAVGRGIRADVAARRRA